MEGRGVKLEKVLPVSPLLDEVVRIWGCHRKTLGLFPRGAFEAYAAAGGIMVAVDEVGTCLGYMAHRRSRGWLVLVHLCTDNAHKGRGAARALVNHLKEQAVAANASGIRLKCRRDYEASTFWPRMKFIARTGVPGRNEAGEDLALWTFENTQIPELFRLGEPAADDRLLVVIDANILYDLMATDGERNQEALALQEPWVQDEVQLCVVDEIHNEIDRGLFKERRQKYHIYASSMAELRSDERLVDPLIANVLEALGHENPSTQELSDARHLAKATAAQAHVFLTRDEELLDARELLEERLDIRILRPVELICELDEAAHGKNYRPARLAGTELQLRTVRPAEIEDLVARFQAAPAGESAARFTALVRTLLTEVQSAVRCVTEVVRDSASSPLALVSRRLREDRVMEVPLLRVGDSKLAPTLARHTVLQLVQQAANKHARSIRVTDPHLTELVTSALGDLHFVCAESEYVRPIVGVTGTWAACREELKTAVEALAASAPALAKIVQELPETTPSGERAVDFEGRFWPLKVLGADIETYVVSIKPTWAMQLFDTGLAEDELFGVPPHLAMNRENVYYRSALPAGITAPARILWYVKKDESRPGSMSIRACSRLLRVEVGTAKDVFRKYRRIGVYEWKTVCQTAGDDPFGHIMALHFADTECFAKPVPWSFTRDLGVQATFQSPARVSEEAFAAIYRYGMGMTSA